MHKYSKFAENGADGRYAVRAACLPLCRFCRLLSRVQTPEQPDQHHCRDGREDHLRGQLRVGEAVQREDPVQHDQRRDFQHDLAQNCEQERLSAHATARKSTHKNGIARHMPLRNAAP